MTDSSTGGYLTPSSSEGLDDEALDKQICQAIAPVAGVGPDLARPRYQAKPPPQPSSRDTDWLAAGVTSQRAEPNSSQVFVDGVGLVVSRAVTLEVVVSVYGPNSLRTVRSLRSGLAVSQNRDGLRAAGLALVEVSDPTLVPELEGQEWVRRADVRLTLRRLETSVYPVESLVDVSVDVVGQGGSASGQVTWHNPTETGHRSDNG